jgi:CBS domain-containing protein
MKTTTESLFDLTAGDLMTRDVVRLPEHMPVREAAHLLLTNQIGGAPVVDGQGKCLGVFSAVDFLRLAARPNDVARPAVTELPRTCSFQVKHRAADGSERTLCTLPPGVCPIQRKQIDAGGEKFLVCSEPHCVLAEWQIVDVEKLPNEQVRYFMTADPVVIKPEVSIRALARMMIDAHIHRVIVVDDENKPIGVVSSTDVLAAIAHAE